MEKRVSYTRKEVEDILIDHALSELCIYRENRDRYDITPDWSEFNDEDFESRVLIYLDKHPPE